MFRCISFSCWIRGRRLNLWYGKLLKRGLSDILYSIVNTLTFTLRVRENCTKPDLIQSWKWRTWWNLCGTSDAFHWQKNKDLCKSQLEPTWGEEFARQGSTDWRPNHGWWENGVAIGALASQAVSRFRIPSWNQPQSFSIYMWQGHDILAKHPIICGRIGMPKPCKSNKGLRTKATSSLFHLSSGVLGLSKQIELSNALRSGSGVALSPALLHDPHDSCRFRWFQVACL